MDYHILALLSWPGHANISQDLAKYHNSYPLNLDEHDGTLLKDCTFHRFSSIFHPFAIGFPWVFPSQRSQTLAPAAHRRGPGCHAGSRRKGRDPAG